MSNRVKRSLGERVFEVFNILFMAAVALIMIYPLLYVIFASLSEADKLLAHSGILFKPIGFSTDAYVMMSKNHMILRGYMNTIFLVLVGTTVNIVLTAMGAYFLSTKGPMFKKAVTIIIIITMYFSGGMIPTYFTVIGLGMENSYLSLILPSAVNTFNLIVMKTAFSSIPDSMRESAYIDGAGEVTILFRIVLPLAKATLAVLILYYAVGHWNSWFNAVLYINDREKYPLQLVLREILVQSDTSSMSVGTVGSDQYAISETIKYAVTVAATLPILFIYPFLQKYFEKGVMIGAVKG